MSNIAVNIKARMREQSLGVFQRSILRLIVGELDRVAKAPTDKQTIAVLQSLKSSAQEMYTLTKDPAALDEIAIYLSFLPPEPTVISEDEIRKLVTEVSYPNLGQLMAALGTLEKTNNVKIDKAFAKDVFNGKA